MLTRERLDWRFTKAGDIEIHYGELGQGDPVICLHGTGPGSDAWSNFRHNLEPLAARFRTILVDLPRFGKSEKVMVYQPRLTFLSGVIRDFMNSLDIESAHFVGNSMGAQTAMKLAIDSPEMVEKMVFIGPAAVGFSMFTPLPTESVKQIASYYKGEGPSLEKMARLLKSLAYDPDFVTDEMIQERFEASIDPEVLEVNAGPHWERQSLEGELERCTAPALLIWGQDDRATALDVGLYLLAKMPDACLHVFGRCGHWAQSEHADEFNRLTLDFLIS
jgi:4,5:9,10-diseco-3-hydroxy-5,9,17-trioxoandrosta-1(10),2-diene-4-oate hydrolase